LPVHETYWIAENAWRAHRHGMRGWLVDLDTGERVPTRERLAWLLDEVGPFAEQASAVDQLADTRTLIAGNGADRQRYVNAREGVEPGGDLMLLLLADEEVGDAGVGAPFLVEALPDLCPDFVVGEGAGERYATPRGPVYLLDCGVKATSTVTLTTYGQAADAS